MNNLHMSDTVSAQMVAAWNTAVRQPDAFPKAIADVEDQMKKELESKMGEPAKSGGTASP